MQPTTDNSDPLKPWSLAMNMARESALGRLRPRSDHSRTAERLQLLAMKVHQVGPISLPLPNIVALQLLIALDCSNEGHVDYVAEAIFILRNQINDDTLFLKGEARRRAMVNCLKDIMAADLPHYILAIREMLDFVQKKSLNSLTTMTQTTETLTRQAASFFSPKPSDNLPPTSPAN